MATQFCPRYSLPADGRILPIALNTTLFSLLGTNYGGDGVSTFALPDLRGRVPMGVGNGAGDPDRVLAQRGRTVKGKHASTVDDPKNPILTLPYLVLQPCIVTDGIFPTQW
jgi:microcystin-dependent protein